VNPLGPFVRGIEKKVPPDTLWSRARIGVATKIRNPVVSLFSGRSG
jgi:hypothetical protein